MPTAQRQAPPRPTLQTPAPTDRPRLGPGDDTGTHLTIGEYIVTLIEKGVYPTHAAATVGIGQGDYMNWLREGQLVLARLNNGAQWETDFTPEQQDFAIFAQAAIQAHANHIARLTLIADNVAVGGIPRRQVRTKSGMNIGENGVQTPWEITTVTEDATLPDAAMLQWRLEHADPTVFGKTATLNVLVHDTTDTPQVAEMLEARMAQIVARFQPDAIEATGEEADDAPEAT